MHEGEDSESPPISNLNLCNYANIFCYSPKTQNKRQYSMMIMSVIYFGSKEMHALNWKHSTLLKYLHHCTYDMQEILFLP